MKSLNLVLILILICCLQGSAQSKKIDSLRRVLSTQKDDTNKVKTLNALAANLYAATPDSTILLAQQASTLASKLGWTLGEAIAYNYTGIAYSEKGDYPNSLNNHRKALKIAEEIGNKVQQARNLGNIGNVYMDQSDYLKALDYDLEALKIAEEIENKELQAMNLGNIGLIYMYQNDYSKALEYDQKALNLAEELGDKHGQALNLGNIGVVYDEQGDYSKALDYYNKALKISVEIGNKDGVTYQLGNIGIVYGEERDYAKAMEYFQKGLEMDKEMGNKNGIAHDLSNIASVYIKTGKFKEAEEYLKKAIVIANNTGEQHDLIQYYEILSQIYDTTGHGKLALLYYQKAMAIKDSLFNIDKSKALTRKEMTYQFEKKEAAQKAEQEKMEALALADKRKQRILIYLFASIALIIGLIAFIISRSLKITKKEKLLVERQKVLLELKALRAQMNPHFIFNAINSIQLFVLENDSDSAYSHLAKFSKLIRMVLENSRYEVIALNKEIEMLQLYLELETIRFSSKFRFVISVNKQLEQENILISPLIIQPYVENAIWHGLMNLKERKGEVVISIEQINNQLKCTIDDNGIGRKHSMELKKGNIHESLGLSITEERLEIINTLYKTRMEVKFMDKIAENGTSGGTCVELLMPFVQKGKEYA